MGTEDISTMSFTPPPFLYDNKCNGLSSTSGISLSVLPYSDHSFPHGWMDSESFMVHSDPSTPYFDFRRGGNAHTIPATYASGQDTSLSDTRKRSPSPRFVSSYVTSDAQFPFKLMDITSDVSLSLLDGGLSDFRENFVSGHMLVPNMVPKPQAILESNPVSGLNVGFSYHHANLGTDFDCASFQTSDVVVSSLSSGSTEGVTNFVSNERQPLNPVEIYRPPQRKGSGRLRPQRACAIKVQEVWVDKEDLNFGADHGSSTISVHECQWAASGNPCGMWIIPSRRSVGNHIRKWHTRQKHANSTVKCFWDGCDETMHKDSINRHVVTVHFGETFHCQGCDQEFPRKDVYNQHVEDDEACRVPGAAMVYSTEHRVIDTRQALHCRGTIRYAGR